VFAQQDPGNDNRPNLSTASQPIVAMAAVADWPTADPMDLDGWNGSKESGKKNDRSPGLTDKRNKVAGGSPKSPKLHPVGCLPAD
jgi:hypothetical protein